MKKMILGFIAGVLLVIVLFYSGYRVYPILQWDWDLKDIHKNCLYFRSNKDINGASYSKIICIKNNYVQ